MRDPALHIKRTNLLLILEKLGININVNDLMREAMKHSIRNRVVVTLPAKARLKAERIVQTETEWVDIFNGIYMATMMENDIKVLPIHKKDPMYLTLKELTNQAVSFCELFDMPYRIGFKKYIELGIFILNKKYSLYRLKASADRIVSLKRDIDTVINDPTPELTETMHTCWLKAMKNHANIEPGVQDNYEKYVNFVYAKQDADSVHAKYDDWLEAQFEKWAFLKSVPELSQLHGENAKINYSIFMGRGSKDDVTIKSDEELSYKEVKFKPRA